MESNPSCRENVTSDVQDSKAPVPIEVTLLGMMIYSR